MVLGWVFVGGAGTGTEGDGGEEGQQRRGNGSWEIGRAHV